MLQDSHRLGKTFGFSTANLHNFLIGSLKLVADFNASFAF